MFVLIRAARAICWLRIQVILGGKPDESLLHNIQLTA
jgi:cytosine/uracil/thiamine/allantoin permease